MTIILDDHFTGTKLDATQWHYGIGALYSNNLGGTVVNNQLVTVAGGVLSLTGTHYGTGAISSVKSMLYGTVTVVAQATSGIGTDSTIFMLPDDSVGRGVSNPNPPEGIFEIDILELPQNDTGVPFDTLHPHFTYHWGRPVSGIGGVSNYIMYANKQVDTSVGFHVYQMVWTPTGISVSLDGKQVAGYGDQFMTNSTDSVPGWGSTPIEANDLVQIPNVPMYLIIAQQIFKANDPKWSGPVNPSILPLSMQIASVTMTQS
jgi:beta-glucanase (GH16 family)